MKKTDNKTLVSALRILVDDIQSGDGIANMSIAEAADRLEELSEAFKPIPIADMPEEMKDGRDVLVMIEDNPFMSRYFKMGRKHFWTLNCLQVNPTHYYTVLEHIQLVSANNAHTPKVAISKIETTEDKGNDDE